MAAVRGRPSGLPELGPGSPTCVQLSPIRLATIGDSLTLLTEVVPMNRYMPLTGHDCTVPALIIDTQAPLDVLHDAAVHRIRAVTQLLENLAFREQLSSDAVVLSDFAHLLAIPLRDGCDLLDVISRRLNADLS